MGASEYATVLKNIKGILIYAAVLFVLSPVYFVVAYTPDEFKKFSHLFMPSLCLELRLGFLRCLGIY